MMENRGRDHLVHRGSNDRGGDQANDDIGATMSPPKGIDQKNKGTQRAVLRLTSIDVVSVAKTVFVISVALSVVLCLLIFTFYVFLSFTGVFNTVDTGSEGDADFTLSRAISPWTMLLVSLGLGVTNIFLMTACGIIFSVIYNVIARITGGVRFTFYR